MKNPKVEFSVKEIFPKIFHMSYRTQGAMTRALIRFSEHYEHPEFRGKVFRIKDVKKYAIAQDGQFDYFTAVAGFNFTSDTFKLFLMGKFNPLSKREKHVLDFFRGMKGEFYVIATFKSCAGGDTAHEISHGLYYTRPKYRKKVREIFSDQDKIGGMASWRRAMIKAGYHEAVVDDEIHAYMMDSDEYLMKKFGKHIPNLAKFKHVRKRLRAAYNLEVEI